MEKMKFVRHSFRRARPHRLVAVALGFLFALMLGRPAFGQQVSVSGKVTNTSGLPLRGVAVQVQGTTTRATTDANGRYTVAAASNGILDFTLLGQRSVQVPVSGRATVDVEMTPIAFLQEMVVTAYAEQRRADITGAVSSAKVETVEEQTGASVLQRLDVAVPGVTVDASGSPGSRSTVRIRGISSFQNNDPLYIVDGIPVQDSYVNWLNPEDITSIQVLKDASAASIYGSRASNGVIVIETTKHGNIGPPRTTLSLRTGVATPTNGYDSFLLTNAIDYYKVVVASYQNAGLTPPLNIFGSATSPTVPKYIWPNNCGPAGVAGPCNTVDPSTYSYPTSLIMPGSQGTDWWKAVFGSAPVRDLNANVSGGSTENAYSVSGNYFDQNGTAKYNDYRRGTVRANTDFHRGKWNFGENLGVGMDRSFGGIADDAFGEGNILGKNILMQPVVPVYDIAGNFASGKATSLGNNTNPLKIAYEARNDRAENDRVFGNVFAGYNLFEPLTVRTRFGFNLGQSTFNGYSPITPENSEPTSNNSINQNQNQFVDWTLSNTAQFVKGYGRSNFDVLAGQESNAGFNKYLQCNIANLLNTVPDSRYCQDALGDATTNKAFSNGGEYALLSFFGKVGYNFADRYVASVTVRRDGSSRLGQQWGTFPAFGLGWHVTNESWFPKGNFISDLNIRYGYGVTGNQLIPPGRIVSQFGGSTGATFYDIGGTKNGIVPGYRITSIGDPNLKWEEDHSRNIGADMSLLQNNLNLIVDVYHRITNNLLFNPALPGTAGTADAPIVNVGSMQNNGVEFSLTHTGSWWNVGFNGSHYANKILKIAGDQTSFVGPVGIRFGNPVINEVGHPIGAFYGYVAQGYFSDAADAAAHTADPVTGKCTAYCQTGAAPGRIKFADINHDGKIDLNDRQVIGSPDPSFTGGLDLGAHRGNFDINATVFGTFGNKIFDAQKQFYVFRNFDTNVRKDLLANSWTPTNQNAKYPILDVNDSYSYALSSYYVENGSYVRLRTLQIGYHIPGNSPFVGRILSGGRIYLQADNLFTITGYEGLDPALSALNVTGAAGDVRDQFRGVDQGTYPSNKIFSIGINTTF
ncbi:MAG TPA: SusC/RagA family TonB-linked outer membrane protein [Gemmatimonadaceae bacterium]